MKKILVATVFVVAFSSIGAIAQGVFIPRPPVVYIPELDPVRMHLEQQLFRDRMNAGGGVVNGKKARVPASNSRAASAKTAKSITAFNPVGGRILPAQLSNAAKKNAAGVSEAKQTFDMFLDNYEKTALNDGFPPNDLAYGLEFFIVNNYIIYNDLQEKSPADKALMSPSGDPLLALQHSYSKKAGAVTSTAEKALYEQLKTLLSENPAIMKLTDRQKQEFTEMLAIVTVTNYYAYEVAGKNKDVKVFAEAQNAAKQSLEKLFGVSANKIKITAKGLEFN